MAARKLAAALIFPVLLAFALGGLRVKVTTSRQRFASAADSTVLLRPLVEFNLSVQRMASSSAPGGQGLGLGRGLRPCGEGGVRCAAGSRHL